MTIGLGLEALIEATPSVTTAAMSTWVWKTSSVVVVGVAGSLRLIFDCAHRLVAGEYGAERVDGGVAELCGDGEQVVRARRLSGLAALDVAPDERGDYKVLVGELGSVGGSGWWRSIIGPAPAARRAGSTARRPLPVAVSIRLVFVLCWRR